MSAVIKTANPATLLLILYSFIYLPIINVIEEKVYFSNQFVSELPIAGTNETYEFKIEANFLLRYRAVRTLNDCSGKEIATQDVNLITCTSKISGFTSEYRKTDQ
uniref:Uncharacterized protein n=1 Tax=Glossina pallidipes TaxID=7398 RepID=A0A1A9ZG00_GLOPL